MSRLKVLFIAGWYPRKEKPVAGVFVREHAKAVSLYNNVVVLYARQFDIFGRSCCKTSDKIEDGIRTIRICYPKIRIPKTHTIIYVWHVFRAFRRLVKEGWRPDVIHAHVYSSAIPAVIIGKLFKIPVVLTEHSSAFPRKLLPDWQIKRARFAMQRAKIILPVSEALKSSIESYGIKNRFQIIPNVVDTNLFHPNCKIKKDTDVKRILLVALLTPVKGVPYLFEALSVLRQKRSDFHLDVVGDGPNRTEYEELAVRLGISNKVCFHGVKTKLQVAEFMRKSHFFVLPSLSETFGVVLIEALASGLPVIATNNSGPSEIVSKEVGLLVPPKSADALAEAIECMLEHHQNYSAERITQYAKENFSYEVVGRKLNNIYQEVKS